MSGEQAGETVAPPLAPPASAGPTTLAIDIGGSGLKASVLDGAGRMVAPRVRVPAPHPCPPEMMLGLLLSLVKPLPPFDRVSVGFPGVVRKGKVLTAPHFDTSLYAGFPLGEKLREALGRPVKLLNDAEVQGFGVIAGHGIEMVLTLGTGAGTALFCDGELAPHLELAQHPAHKGKTYDEYVGRAALDKVGPKRWSKRVLRAIGQLDRLVNYDMLYIGGGNAAHIAADLPERTKIVANDAGIMGGIALWKQRTASD